MTQEEAVSFANQMLEMGVESFTYQDFTVKFILKPSSPPTVTTIDPKEASEFLKQTLAEANRTEQEDLLWSTP